MRNFLDAKAMAKALRTDLERQNIAISHSQSLEIVARQFSCGDWNELAAKIAASPASSAVSFAWTAPIFRIFEEAKVREYYLDFLGFKLDWEHRFDKNAPLYAQVSRAGFTLHLSGHHGDASPGATAFVAMSGIHAYQKELLEKQYKHNKPELEEVPWGLHMTVTDPFSNRIRFCEYTDA